MPGRLRDHVERVLTDLPVVGHPTRLRVRLPRFVCSNVRCAVTVFRQRMGVSPLGWWGFGPAADRGGWALVCR
ncbi:transposase family protein [Mycolicibacter engbaekii]|uniref:transposase family protein n=1 Tax=Mycolicibacter engbaekii TaxID=188915 RepID=UPI001A988288|nr:transposase family protein [Mycolicibacter engbaekii]